MVQLYNNFENKSNSNHTFAQISIYLLTTKIIALDSLSNTYHRAHDYIRGSAYSVRGVVLS